MNEEYGLIPTGYFVTSGPHITKREGMGSSCNTGKELTYAQKKTVGKERVIT